MSLEIKTVVFQSYRVTEVAKWIGECMSSVKEWAAYNDFDYRFYDDSFFDFAPDWYRQKVDDSVHLLSDLCRLEMAKRLLHQGYDKAIWVDADVIVFDIEKFSLPLSENIAFCKELWVQPSDKNSIIGVEKVNNAVTLFSKESTFIDYYIGVCHRIVRETHQLKHADVGTNFLTEYNKENKIDFINQVGLFSPTLNRSILDNNVKVLSGYIKSFGSEIYAANLCATFQDKTFFGITLNADDFSSVVSLLVKTKGQIINRYLID